MYARHDLVWLTAPGWLAARAAAAPAHAEALARWQSEDWPLTVRRDDADCAPGQLGLGLSPAPAGGAKVRIAVRAAPADVARSTAPLPLKAVLAALPGWWRLPLRALHDESLGLTLRAYGSVALQALTGQDYIGPASDIDLLFYPNTERQLRAGLALLTKHAGALPLDGEVVFPGDRAVAWKEWIVAEARQARVLVKERGGVRLAPVNALLASLGAA
ncbi:MAG TPA: malonate decarboxylase holo-[acyl-carrier-protein] synthase [Janthinobacterium sp.]|nr:malonate decarboxylase holo-[acyl-carrier-protein] synthase [Janthinobacterium sp.]